MWGIADLKHTLHIKPMKQKFIVPESQMLSFSIALR